MTFGRQTSTRTMTWGYVSALSVVAALTLANYLALRAEIRASATTAEILNASARQRMLLQRTALLAQELAVTTSESNRDHVRTRLVEAIDPLQATHHLLIGEDSAGRTAAPEQVERVYFDAPWLLDTEMRNYLAQLRSIAESESTSLHMDDPQVRYVRDVAVSRPMAEALDAVVAAYQSQSDSQTAQIRLLAQWILASTLGVLLAIGGFLFRPMVNRVRVDMLALSELNDSLEQRVAERTATAEERALALAESEAAFRSQARILQSILDHMGDAVVVTDADNELLLANPAARHLLSLDVSSSNSARVAARQWTDRLGVEFDVPEDGSNSPHDPLPLSRAIRGEIVDRAEIVVRSATTSEERCLSVTARPLCGDEGETQGAVAVLRDITERKRAEQKLRNSAALYQSLVDSLPMCVVRKDRDGRFTFANDRFTEFVGQPPERILGRTHGEFSTAQVATALLADDQRVQQSGEVLEIIERWETPEGRRVFVQMIKSPVRDGEGNIVGTQMIFWDVTERELAEQERREMHVVLENAVEGIAGLDDDRRFQTINRTLADMLRTSQEELSGHDWRQLIHPEDRSVAKRLAQQLQTGKRASAEARVLRRDGTEFPAELLLVSAPAEHARSVSHVCFVKDISERKSAERKLLQSERLAAIGQMVTGVAHESRNALQQIQACSQMLKWRLNGSDETVALVDDIELAEDRLLRLFDDLRGYASPINLERRPEDMSEVLRRAWDSLRPAIRGRDATLKLQAGADWICEIDAFQMEQVFRNLMENSLAACEDPVRIDVRCDQAIRDGRDSVQTMIADNGPGLAQEVRSRFFEPFFTTKTRGTGLGTVICKRIVEAHDGSIEIALDRQQGTEIVITLPRRSS